MGEKLIFKSILHKKRAVLLCSVVRCTYAASFCLIMFYIDFKVRYCTDSFDVKMAGYLQIEIKSGERRKTRLTALN